MEKGFRIVNGDRVVKDKSELYLLKLIRETLGTPPQSHAQHANDTQDGINNHVSILMESLVKKYHTARIHEVARRVNNEFQANSTRQKSNKLVVFKNQ